MTDNQIININGIDCYEKDGVAYLKLETVARGLGFIRVAASGNEVVRWETVRRYLTELGVPTSWHGDSHEIGRDGLPEYIPENIFYRLAMKAKNEAAEKFQAKVADEVIPSIRKHGAYMTSDTIDRMIQSPEFGIKLLTALQEERGKREALQEQNAALLPKAEYYDAVKDTSTVIQVKELSAYLCSNGVKIGRNKLFEKLRNDGFLCKSGETRNLPTQEALDAQLMEVKQSVFVRNGEVATGSTTYITQKGLEYFLRRYGGVRQHKLTEASAV